MLQFILGFLLGAKFGILIICLFTINKKEEKNDGE